MGGILPEINRKLAEGKNRSSQLEFEPLGAQWHQFSYLSSVVTTAQIQEWKMQLFSFIYQKKKKHSVSTYFMSGTILGSEDIIMNKMITYGMAYHLYMAVYVSIFPFTCQTLCKNNEENGKMPSILHLSTKIDIISRFQIATAKSILRQGPNGKKAWEMKKH